MIPLPNTGNCRLDVALQDIDYNGNGIPGRLTEPALKDRVKDTTNVSLKALGGTVTGMNSVSAGYDVLTNYHSRRYAYPGCWITQLSYGSRSFTPSNSTAQLGLSRNTSGDAVIECRYHGWAPDAGLYNFKAKLNRNYSANGGAPHQIGLFASNTNWLGGNLWTIYLGADWASGFQDQYTDYSWNHPAGYGYISVVVYHKVFGTVGGHSQSGAINTVYNNYWDDCRVTFVR